MDKRLILEILPRKNGHTYPFFRVYVPTSAPGGAYFVRYNFNYEYNDDRQNYAPNSTTNVSNYRIREAQLVRVTDVSAEGVMQETVLPVLQAGEISLAIREALPDTAHLVPGAVPSGKEGEYYAADFIGGPMEKRSRFPRSRPPCAAAKSFASLSVPYSTVGEPLPQRALAALWRSTRRS